MQLLNHYAVPVFRFLKYIVSRPAVVSFAHGAIVCAMLLVALAQFVATFGASDLMQTTSILGVTAGVIFGLLLRTAINSSGSLQGLAWILSACWLVLFPTWLTLARSLWQGVDLTSGNTTSTALFTLSLATAAICLAPGCLFLTLIPVRRTAFSLGLGTAVAGLLLPPLFGSTASLSSWSLVLGVAASITGSLTLWLRQSHSDETATAPQIGESAAEEVRPFVIARNLSTALAAGAAFAVMLHISRQLVVATLPSLSASWSGGILGISAGYALSHRLRSKNLLAAFASLTGALGLAIVLGFYGSLAETTLWSTAWISQVWLLFLVRGSMLACMTFPCGFAAGVAAGRFQWTWSTPLTTGACVVGYLAGFWSPFHPVTAAFISSGILLLIGLAEWFISWNLTRRLSTATIDKTSRTAWLSRIEHVRQMVLPTMAAAALLIMTLMSGNYRPADSEKFLFAGGAFAAYRNGIEPSQLPFLDDGRLILERETLRGRVSLWKHRGVQFALRENGLPVSWTSGAPELGPDNTPEVISVLLPLVMNSQAERILLTGGPGTAGLFTALSFPVQEVTNLTTDGRSQEILHALADLSTLGILMRDVRLKEREFDSGLLAISQPVDVPFDVIISQDGQSGLLQNLPRFTRAYYQGLRRNLTADGILCQRLGYFDLGPEAVKRVVSTVQSVFPQVVLVEATPGELILLASSKEEPLFNQSTVTQLKAEHSREILSRIGWDWSMVANLGALKGESTLKFISQQQPIDPLRGNTAFTFPHEIARWGEKWGATRQQLGKYGESFGNWLTDVDQIDEIRKRLEDVKLARETIDEHPDQFWTYRNAIKKRLQDRPRSDIVQAHGGTGLKYGLHPEDQRRKDYLAALGNAVSVASPDPALVVRLNDFQDPYDPLVTYFLHQEAAYLLQRSSTPEPGLQLAHWLHAIYFAPAQDRSVRDVCEALSLLHETPECVVEEGARFDHLNGLLEMLRYRWDLRLSKSSLSRFEAADVEQSLNVTRSTLDDMQALAQKIGVEPRGWQIRREVIEDQLLRPLRVHRSELAKRNIPQPKDEMTETAEAASPE